MMIKRLPQDFQVEELTDLRPRQQGAHALYRLEKIGWTTPDALHMIRRVWKIDPRRVSYGGLKDRHAHTVQYITILNGPRRRFAQERIHLDYLGQTDSAFSSRDIRANRFRIVLRRMSGVEVERATRSLGEIEQDGLANYFDDQRFGSVERETDFAALGMIRGDWEGALRQALTSAYEHDRSEQKKEKRILRSHWGDWSACKQLLPRGHARSLADYLSNHPHHYRGALERLRPELRGLLLSAFQSHLWNRMLALWLEENLADEQLVRVDTKLRTVPMQRGLNEEQRAVLDALMLPLPSARTKLDTADPMLVLAERVLADYQLTWAGMKVPGSRDLFFSKGDRAALCRPMGIQHQASMDDLHAGREKLSLAFDLPRGSYATMVVKRITNAETQRGEPAKEKAEFPPTKE